MKSSVLLSAFAALLVTSPLFARPTLDERVTVLEYDVAALKQKSSMPAKSAVVPAKTRAYNFAAACADIYATNKVMKDSFQVQVLKEIQCGSTTFVYVRTFSPGYTPEVSLDVFRKDELVFFPQ